PEVHEVALQRLVVPILAPVLPHDAAAVPQGYAESCHVAVRNLERSARRLALRSGRSLAVRQRKPPRGLIDGAQRESLAGILESEPPATEAIPIRFQRVASLRERGAGEVTAPLLAIASADDVEIDARPNCARYRPREGHPREIDSAGPLDAKARYGAGGLRPVDLELSVGAAAVASTQNGPFRKPANEAG